MLISGVMFHPIASSTYQTDFSFSVVLKIGYPLKTTSPITVIISITIFGQIGLTKGMFIFEFTIYSFAYFLQDFHIADIDI